MKEVVVLSGKGGTGKTSIAACFAALASSCVACDADVDAADLHLLLQPEETRTHEFRSGQRAWIDLAKCTDCGICRDNCRFEAIQDSVVDQWSCEGCGFCSHICPEGAIAVQEQLAGHWFLSRTRYGSLVHARLGIAEENSGKLVTLVRNEAKRIAQEQGRDFIITDGPPGIGCPVISSLSGAGLALIVTEPTLSGMHDLERVTGVCRYFNVPAVVCINKCDINPENAGRIESLCREAGTPVVAQLPYDNIFSEALVRGVPLVEFSRGEMAQRIGKLWESISKE